MRAVRLRGLWAGPLILLVAAGCSAGASPPAGGATPRRGASSSRRTAAANRGLSSAVSQCLRLKDPTAGVAAYAADGARLPFDVFAGHEPGTQPRCRPDELRVSRMASLTIDGQPTYVRRGGCQTPCVVRQATVHVPAGSFASSVRLLSPAARHGDGAPVADCRAGVRDAPQLAGRALARMFYKRPNVARPGRAIRPAVGARWSNYGNPGALYRTGGRPATSYNYLLWNLPRTARGVLHGGGIVEAVLAQGDPIELCRATHLTLPAYGADGRSDGDVAFAYATVHTESGAHLYGWVLVDYTYQGRRQRLTT
jgi:hypothetical protein